MSTILILPICEHIISFYLHLLQFLSSKSYSFQCMGLSLTWLNLFLCVVFFCFLVFLDAIVNGIVFLFSLSDNLLLAYRHATDFCIFIFHSVPFLNLFILTMFLVEAFMFSIYNMSPINTGSFTSFLFWMLFISFLF